MLLARLFICRPKCRCSTSPQRTTTLGRPPTLIPTMEAEQKTRLALLADGAIYVTEAYRAAAAYARYARRDADLLVALERGDAGGRKRAG